MRILYLTDRLSDRGGADHHLAQVIADARSAGHDVVVGYGRRQGSALIPDSVKRVRLKGLASAVPSSSGNASLAGLVAEADVVHVQNVMNPTALAAAVSPGRAVVTVQDHRVFCPGPGKTLPDGSCCRSPMNEHECEECLPDARYRRSMVELTELRRQEIAGAALVTLSRYMAGELARVGLGDAVVIPPWVEVGREAAVPGSYFVIAGRFVEHKGARAGFQAWREAGRPAPLLAAGDGPLLAELDGVEPLGWLAAPDLRILLRRARALLLPARWQEPFGIIGVEALAEATPVVVTAVGGVADWAGEGCIVVPPGDTGAMAAAIRDLAADPERATALGQAGRSAVQRRFDRRRVVTALNELYRRVAGA